MSKICPFFHYVIGNLQQKLTLRKCLRIRSVISVISVDYHYITVLGPFNLSIHFKCYNTV